MPCMSNPHALSSPPKCPKCFVDCLLFALVTLSFVVVGAPLQSTIATMLASSTICPLQFAVTLCHLSSIVSTLAPLASPATSPTAPLPRVYTPFPPPVALHHQDLSHQFVFPLFALASTPLFPAHALPSPMSTAADHRRTLNPDRTPSVCALD